MKNRAKPVFCLATVGYVLSFVIACYGVIVYDLCKIPLENKLVYLTTAIFGWVPFLQLAFLYVIYETYCYSQDMRTTLVKGRIAFGMQMLFVIIMTLPKVIYEKVAVWGYFILLGIPFVIGMILHILASKEVVRSGVFYKDQNAKLVKANEQRKKLPFYKWTVRLFWTVVGVAALSEWNGKLPLVPTCIVFLGLGIEFYFLNKYIQAYRSMPGAELCKRKVRAMVWNFILSNAAGLGLGIWLGWGLQTDFVFVTALYSIYLAEDKYLKMQFAESIESERNEG